MAMEIRWKPAMKMMSLSDADRRLNGLKIKREMPKGSIKMMDKSGSGTTVSVGSGNSWVVSKRAAGEIMILKKKLDATGAYLDSIWKKLLGASVEYGEDLGIYRDVLEDEIKVIDVLNKECRESLDELCGRLDKYAAAILKECNGKL